MASKEESVISSFNLDEKAFRLCCNLFVQHSGVIRDGWSWAEVKGGKEGYMKKTAVIPGRSCCLSNHQADDEMNDLTEADELENEVAGPSTVCNDQVLMHYEYHVLYSFSHQVPVLYFRACTLDGQSLSLDEDKEKKKKESIFDLSKYIDKTIRVKFQGGREASGVLKGFDPLLNLVLDGTIEYMRDPDDQYKLTEDTRQLGLVVCRGTAVVLICPQDGMEAIPNPFIQQQDG
ncbi:U6 snRNA-associated Sm-like protein LSm7 [Bagarius yarrelli]|uniref:U6 snRNA-associated Sm-like protein LSm7 n=1 Tax=Bagarius yarrelli TaxID=175774 RepID=A0A556TSE7_BAGYA|nr:U6 snRNA-associated Sm-like protein LSm7 [Bagarius yarrelli]